ncbi:hypothetical protein RGAI101_2623 [Roseobacter sp. GAI101]|nr:hypothetical protein RGAI101_2623 [Roseobacter sp. GAI101]
MVVANGLAGSFTGPLDPQILAKWGIGVDALRGFDISRFMTAIFLSHDPSMLARQFFFAAGVIGLTEWIWGSWRAAALFFGLDIVSAAALIAVIAFFPVLDPLAEVTDVGMSLGGFGLIGVLLSMWRHRWIGLIGVSVLVATKYAFAPDPVADGGHVIALMIGFCVGLARFHIPGLSAFPSTQV